MWFFFLHFMHDIVKCIIVYLAQLHAHKCCQIEVQYVTFRNLKTSLVWLYYCKQVAKKHSVKWILLPHCVNYGNLKCFKVAVEQHEITKSNPIGFPGWLAAMQVHFFPYTDWTHFHIAALMQVSSQMLG